MRETKSSSFVLQILNTICILKHISELVSMLVHCEEPQPLWFIL